MVAKRILVIDDSPTILKVVELTLTRSGYPVITAPDGEAGVALARAQLPDLILLDFVMPRMNGYQVVRALAEDAQLRDIPVVLMSAKGDQVGERFVKVLGIVDYITKPFSPEAIVAVVSHSLEKYGRTRPAGEGAAGGEGAAAALAPGAPAAATEAPGAAVQPTAGPPASSLGSDGAAALPLPAEVRALAEAGPPSATPRGEAPEVDRRRAALAALRQELARSTAEQLRLRLESEQQGLPGSALEVSRLVQELISACLGDERLDKLVSDVEASSPLGPEAQVLTGDLRVVPIAEVLGLLSLQGQTGVLTLHRPPSHVDVYFRHGRVELATGSGLSEEFLLGRFLLESELMSRQDLDQILKSRNQSKKLLGGQLVKLGYITEEDLKRAIRQQTCEMVYEILRWKFGRFAFRAQTELPAAALDAQLGLTVDGILMEGFRRVDEWHLIEREVDNFDLVFVRNEDAVAQMGRGRLTRDELTVLELVNGKSSVKDIVRQSHLSSFDVSKMLYRLHSIKLVRKRVLPVAV